MHALVMLQVMQHAECADPKAIHSPITIPYHTYGNIISPKNCLCYRRNSQFGLNMLMSID